jgi:hypothetical protein
MKDRHPRGSSGHPKVAATVLMVGIVVLIFAIAALSSL